MHEPRMRVRRRLVSAVAAAAVMGVLGPGRTLAQPSRTPRIGFLVINERESFALTVGQFRQGMKELGHVEGKSYVLEIRNALGRTQRFPDLAAELVRMKVDVLVATSSEGILAASEATRSIPIVFGAGGDPVGLGYVASLARPGGNMTGTSLLLPELGAKQLELLKSASPGLTRFAILRPATVRFQPYLDLLAEAANRTKVSFREQVLTTYSLEGVESSLNAMRQEGVQGFILFPHAVFFNNVSAIAALAMKLRMASLFPYAEGPRAGALMSYFPVLQESFKRMSVYADKILKGAKPADLPVEQPTRFHLALNQRTAKTLGLTLPPDLLVRADEVIE